MACLFSVQAGASESAIQIQKRQQYVPPPPQTTVFIQNQNNIQSTQWVTHSVQRLNVPYAQTDQQSSSSTSAGQDLKQFSDQAQQQMADFRKL
jgi:hypothetical protein